MMGRTHIVTTQVAWLAIAPLYTDHTWKIVAGIPVAGLAALGPDIDSGGSTICRILFWLPDGLNAFLHAFLGVRKRRVGDAIGRALGGHRYGTHSALSVLVVFWLSVPLVQFVDGWWLTMALTAGWLAHIVEDCATQDGCALAWPYSRRQFRYLSLKVDDPWEIRFYHLMNLAAVWLILNLAGIDTIAVIQTIGRTAMQ
jgi:membrane-bound metal-dependent hydrolase YbcI (DUF457 family)